MFNKETVSEAYKQIQDEICRGLEAADGTGSFEEELWERTGGGGGRTRIMQNGSVIEKGGVNFSAVYGKLPEAVKRSLNAKGDDFYATGVSIVIHPDHPLVPIVHMNIRYFEMNDGVRWFGGGIDLTPHYVFEEDARFFHEQLKAVCNAFDPGTYTKFKTWADNYFFISHRNETRGIGGIFYDKLTPESSGLGWDQLFDFSRAVGGIFLPAYTELIKRHRDKPFTAAEKQWQYNRRSRYVEFNLVYDAGTKFGLQTNGRIESILMSLPPQANWEYNYKPLAGSEEEKTINFLKKGIDWASK